MLLKRTTPILLCCLGFIPSAFAHNVKHDNDVGATFHIEPNHNPRAGEESLAWFALAGKGGKVIALKDCDCRLQVNLKEGEREKRIAIPNLQAISTENYRDIPGAKITFPKAGIYELSIIGIPKSGNSFSPFELDYQVVVGAGNSQPESTPKDRPHKTAKTESDTGATTETANSGESFRWIVGSLGGIAVVGSGILLLLKTIKK